VGIDVGWPVGALEVGTPVGWPVGRLVGWPVGAAVPITLLIKDETTKRMEKVCIILALLQFVSTFRQRKV
jgi:hypothetical protein